MSWFYECPINPFGLNITKSIRIVAGSIISITAIRIAPLGTSSFVSIPLKFTLKVAVKQNLTAQYIYRLNTLRHTISMIV
jgi:hypothetical protein